MNGVTVTLSLGSIYTRHVLVPRDAAFGDKTAQFFGTAIRMTSSRGGKELVPDHSATLRFRVLYTQTEIQTVLITETSASWKRFNEA